MTLAGALATVALIVGVLSLGFATPASASTAQLVDVPYLEPQCGKYFPEEDCRPRPVPMLVYEAGRGEANRVRIEARDGMVRIRDLGAAIRPGIGCSRVGRHRVSCAMPDQNEGIYVATGDRADRVSSGPAHFVDGGSGDDVLVGGAGDDQLFGGRGRDVLRAGAGADILYDAAPPRMFRAGDPSPFDVHPIPDSVPLVSPGAGRDSFDGGAGHDLVSYAARSANITVDLATRAPIGGQRGEHDSVRRVEHATGGTGDDRLMGDRGLNEFRAGPGDDRIAGRGGNDYLEGGPGRNVMSGGAGNDQMNGNEGEPERIACGSGTDQVYQINTVDFVGDDCEQIGFFRSLNSGIVRSLLPLREGQPPTVLVATVACYTGCRGSLELSVDGPGVRGGRAPPPGTLLGCQSYGPSAGGPQGPMELSLGLSAAGLASVRHFRALRVRVSFTREDVSYGGGVARSGYLTVVRTPLRAPQGSTRARPGAAERTACG